VQITDTSGDVLATTFIHGIGIGPQIAFGPGSQTTLSSEAGLPYDEAVDGAGDIFIADAFNDTNTSGGQVVEVPAGGGAQTKIGSGLFSPHGVAVDGAGDVFIADSGNNRVVEVSVAGAQTTVGSGLSSPEGVAVDGAGNVFIADTSNKRVLEVPAGGSTQMTVGSGMDSPTQVAVDGVGNVFIADGWANCVWKVPADGSAQTKVDFGTGYPVGVAVDGAGNVFVSDYYNSRLVEVPTVGVPIVLASGLSHNVGITVDGAGDIFTNSYFASSGRFLVVELHRSAPPPTLTFPTSTPVNTLDSNDQPQTVTIQNVGNEPLVFTVPTTGSNPAYPVNFPVNSADTSLCTSASPLSPGADCDVSMEFKPNAVGVNTGAVVLTNNALNAVNSTQTVSLTGNGVGGQPPINWATPAAITYGTALSTTQLDATSTVAGTFAYTPATGTVLGTGTQTLSVTFTPTDTTDYTTATATVQLTINKATPTIIWATPAAITYGTALSATQLGATSTVAGFFAYTPAAGTVLNPGTQTLSVTFTPIDITDYTTATATASLTVNPALESLRK
jgi:sugar lactone lactonase YvrE